ncbi:unnamed protein product [Arabidopsis thaliana]|uniref:(thale cress) hypothetical protein n=1 Tax=Arabidopsis thaliana TaxID=3702 RepID=A0A7G2FDT6_ARATH|nr:unnamed protein product [Arabidopsis thaliana]
MASSTSLAIVLHQSSNHDELFMKQTLQFSETLKDLKNLRKQLYSAAEYFETSYGKEEHKETVIETLKEYAAKAVVNTVDHLGSVSDKFNSFLSDNSTHFSTTHLRLSSLEQITWGRVALISICFYFNILAIISVTSSLNKEEAQVSLQEMTHTGSRVLFDQQY